MLYRPEGWTTEVLFYPIEIFADRANKSRRQIDRHIEAGELTKVKWNGLSWIPVHELERLGFPDKKQNGLDGYSTQQHASAGAPTEPEAETAPEVKS